MEKLKNLKFILILVFLITMIPLVSACENTGYKIMSVKEGIQGFSFEYPQEYSLIHLDLENTFASQYTEVGMSANDGVSFSEIYVYIWFPSSDMSTSKMVMDWLLDNANSTLKDFNLVNNAPVVLGDTFAQQAIFTADSSIGASASLETTTTGTNEVESSVDSSMSRPATYRITSMIYSGLAIEIDMTCDIAITDATAEDYQHVLDTFTIVY